MPILVRLVLFFALLLPVTADTPKPLEKFENRTLVKTAWADGDSFNSHEAAAMLQDLELVAAKRGAGVWAKTDWDQLAAERDAERRENKIPAGKE